LFGVFFGRPFSRAIDGHKAPRQKPTDVSPCSNRCSRVPTRGWSSTDALLQGLGIPVPGSWQLMLCPRGSMLIKLYHRGRFITLEKPHRTNQILFIEVSKDPHYLSSTSMKNRGFNHFGLADSPTQMRLMGDSVPTVIEGFVGIKYCVACSRSPDTTKT
jgi:hypothetical protein